MTLAPGRYPCPMPDGDEAAAAPKPGPRFDLRRLGAAGPLALVAAIFPAIGGFVLLGTLDPVGRWLVDIGAAGVVVYAVAFALLSGFALLPTYAQAILGGWAFGFAVGFPAALAGFLGGAAIGYVIARRAASEPVTRMIDEKPRWAAVRDALVGSGPVRTFGIVTLVRLPPNSPFALTNLVMGTTRVAPVPYLLGTLVGLAPRTGVAVYLAAGVKDLMSAEKARPSWLFWSGLAVTVVAVLVIGSIAQRALRRVTAGPAAGVPGADPADSAS